MQTSLSLLVFKEQKAYPAWDTRILAEVEVFFQYCNEIGGNGRIGVGKYSFPYSCDWLYLSPAWLRPFDERAQGVCCSHVTQDKMQ